MSAKQKNAETRRRARYNPCDETTDAESVAAANWELLRRIPDLQETAGKWTTSAAFRRQHVAEKGRYAANDPARCALDWMLTPTERLELAEFQKAKRLLFLPDRACPQQAEWNFGPIIIDYDWNAHDGRFSDCIDKIVSIRPMKDSVGRVTLETSWKDAPDEFKRQFRQTTIGGPAFTELKLQDVGILLAKTGDALLARESLSKDEQERLGRCLFSQGQYFRAIDKSFKVAAIPRVFMDERKVDEMLRQIKAGLRLLRRTGHDWNTKKSFLGTAYQWDRFLAWEAHGKSAYQAAAEFLREDDSRLTTRKGKRGEPLRSEVQRDIAGSITTAVKAIKSWFPRLYPVRNLWPRSQLTKDLI